MCTQMIWCQKAGSTNATGCEIKKATRQTSLHNEYKVTFDLSTTNMIKHLRLA